MNNRAVVPNRPFRVLVIKPSSLGDIIHAFPAVELLLRYHPNARIDWLVHPAFVDVLKYCPNLARVVLFPRKELGKAKTFLPYFLRLSRDLRRRRYDLVLDFQGLMRSAIFGRLARAGRFVGFADPREPIAKVFYRERVKVTGDSTHAVEKNLAFVAELLGVPVPADFQATVPAADPDAAAAADKLLAETGAVNGAPILGIIPGARWETKRWPESFFARVIDDLSERHPTLRFALLGAPSEAPAAEQIKTLVKHPDRLLMLAGRTSLTELTETIRRTVGLLSNDSGPMHVAAALRIPVFAMFGPTVPEKTGPWGRIHTIFQPELECRGCLKRRCPQGHDRCRELIDPAAVANAISTTINGEKPCSAIS